MKYIIFDVDNTIADQTDRENISTKDGKLNWALFKNDELLAKDKPIPQTLEILKMFKENYKIIIVTARDEGGRRVTEGWLERHKVKYDHLFMRKMGDFRPDVEVKQDIYQEHLKDLDVYAVFDDRPRIIKLWQSKGFFTFECNNRKGDW